MNKLTPVANSEILSPFFFKPEVDLTKAQIFRYLTNESKVEPLATQTKNEVIDAFLSHNPLAVNFNHLRQAGSGYITQQEATALYQEVLGESQTPQGRRGLVEMKVMEAIADELIEMHPEQAGSIDATLDSLKAWFRSGDSQNIFDGLVSVGGSALALAQLADCIATVETSLLRAFAHGDPPPVKAIQAAFGLVYAATQPVGPVRRLTDNTADALILVGSGLFSKKSGD